MKFFIAALVLVVVVGVISAAPAEKKSKLTEKTHNEESLLESIIEKLDARKTLKKGKGTMLAKLALLDMDKNKRLTSADMLQMLLTQAAASKMMLMSHKDDDDNEDVASELQSLYVEFGPLFEQYDADGDGEWDEEETDEFFQEEFDYDLSDEYYQDILTLIDSDDKKLTQKQCFVVLLAIIEYFEYESGDDKKTHQLKNKMSRLSKLSRTDTNNDKRLTNADMLHFLVGKAKSSNMLKKLAVSHSKDDDSQAGDLYSEFEAIFEKYDANGDGELDYAETEELFKNELGVDVSEEYFDDVINIIGSTDQELTEDECFIGWLAAGAYDILTEEGDKKSLH